MARYEYQKRYVKDHYTNFTIVMKKGEDRELIAHLQAKKNKSEYQRVDKEGYGWNC